MSREKGQANFSTAFEPQVALPLDARMLVQTKADLINPNTWTANDGIVYIYPGIIVTVSQDNIGNRGTYRLDALPYTDISNWKRLTDEKSSSSIIVKTVNDWITDNTILEDGQIGMEKITGKYKVGDGTTTWAHLPYTTVSQQAVPWKREIIILSSTQIINKYIEVVEPILFTETLSFVSDAGLTGILGEDFTISQPSTISWNGFEWDGLLEESDKIQIIYK
jgi:hypothetical protein